MQKFPKPYFRTQRGTWAVQINGRQVGLGRDRKAAFAEYHRLMAAEGREVPREKITTGTLLDLFLDHVQRRLKPATFEWYRNYLQSFNDRYESLPVQAILPLHVTGWLDAHPAWGPSTRRGAITAIKRCWAWACEEGRLATNPLARIVRPAMGRRKVMSDDGAATFLAAVPPGPLLDYVVCLIQTGCRPGELVTLEARTVDLGRSLMVVDGKSGERRVMLSAKAKEVIGRLASEHPVGPIFRNFRGKPWNRNSLRCSFRRIRRATGVEGAVPYTFRHLFGSLAIERGVDSLIVAELMGHKDVSMLKDHYVRHKAETLRLAVEQATRPVS